jgi:hypothetical protein
MADAIGHRDLATIRTLLSREFTHRKPGGPAVDADLFLRGIEQIPGEIAFVRLEQLEVDMSDAAALVTGIQHAQVRLDGKVIDDRRTFVDWFVNEGGEWRIRVALDVPGPGTP